MKKILLSMLSLLILFGCAQPLPQPEEEIPEEEIPEEEVIVEPAFRSKFNGEGLDVEEYKAVAAMIGNTSEARPQSGLSLADVVYEIMMEGLSITRLMAIFSSEYPEKVGPLRSIRIPFVQKLDEWDIGIAHYGGAQTGLGDALTLLGSIKVPIRFDGVKGYNTEYFWRDSARKAPHNAYMNLAEAIDEVPVMEIKKHFTFDPKAEYEGTSAKTVNIRYTSSIRVKYEYDAEVEKYTRYFNEVEQIDAYNDEPIQVTNVIIQTVPYKMVEDVAYVLVDFNGSGPAEYYIKGVRIEGTWEREDSKSVTVYYDLDHNEIKLQPGNTWIHVALKNSTKVTFE